MMNCDLQPTRGVSATLIGGSLRASVRRMASIIMLGLLMEVTSGNLVRAESEIPFTLAGTQSGTVTAIHETSFEINGVNFHLASDVVIVDSRGNPLEAHAIRVSAEVRYLVKKEQAHTIVKMVLYLPQ